MKKQDMIKRLGIAGLTLAMSYSMTGESQAQEKKDEKKDTSISTVFKSKKKNLERFVIKHIEQESRELSFNLAYGDLTFAHTDDYLAIQNNNSQIRIHDLEEGTSHLLPEEPKPEKKRKNNTINIYLTVSYGEARNLNSIPKSMMETKYLSDISTDGSKVLCLAKEDLAEFDSHTGERLSTIELDTLHPTAHRAVYDDRGNIYFIGRNREDFVKEIDSDTIHTAEGMIIREEKKIGTKAHGYYIYKADHETKEVKEIGWLPDMMNTMTVDITANGKYLVSSHNRTIEPAKTLNFVYDLQEEKFILFGGQYGGKASYEERIDISNNGKLVQDFYGDVELTDLVEIDELLDKKAKKKDFLTQRLSDDQVKKQRLMTNGKEYPNENIEPDIELSEDGKYLAYINKDENTLNVVELESMKEISMELPEKPKYNFVYQANADGNADRDRIYFANKTLVHTRPDGGHDNYKIDIRVLENPFK